MPAELVAKIIKTISIVLWIIAILIAVRVSYIFCFQKSHATNNSSSNIFKPIFTFIVLLTIAFFLFMRPHEDILGGEDPGSYVNSAATFNRIQHIYYIDPLLSQVDQNVRSNFYIGHKAGFGTTKDACLWIRNESTALIGPHFQPAYSFLMSFAISLKNDPIAALYVVPIFAIMCAIAIGVLIQITLPQASYFWRIVAFLLYILNPFVIWHGRHARPEVIAAFMLIAGTALLFNSIQNKGFLKIYDVISGSIAILIAPFFHITALIYVLAVSTFVLIMLLAGYSFFIFYPILAIGVLGCYVFQTKYITDYYNTLRFIQPLYDKIEYLAIGIICIFIISLTVKKVLKNTDLIKVNTSDKLAVAFTIFISFLFIFIWLINWLYPESTLFKKGIVEHYIYLTNIPAVMNMLNPVLVMLALVGLIFSIVSPIPERNITIILFIIGLPSLLFMGKIENFMMSRYMMIAFVPFFTIYLTFFALFLSTTLQKRWGYKMKNAPYFIVIIIIALQLYGRTHLITITENKGLLNFLMTFAEEIKRANGILLSEYPRLSAPLEHIAGIPTLSIDNEMQNDYRAPLKEWAKIMSNMPSYKAFFLTPFQSPLHPDFIFNPITNAVFTTKRVKSAGNAFPRNIGQVKIDLKLFEMLKTEANSLKAFKPQGKHPMRLYSSQIEIGAGNVGLLNFDKFNYARWEIYGAFVDSNKHISLLNGIKDQLTSFAPDRIDIVVFSYSGCTPQPLRCAGARTAPPVKIAENWYFYPLPGGIIREAPALFTETPLLFTQIIAHKGRNELISILPDGGEIKKAKEPLPARWTKADSAIALPAFASGEEPELWCFCYVPIIDKIDKNYINFVITNMTESLQAVVSSGRWQWAVIKLPELKNTLVAQPAYWAEIKMAYWWNPERQNFSSNLGVLLAYPVLIFRK